MVWFDCQCGESLKKPSVGKHLLGRRCSFVTCVDCSTTFHGNEFEAHIKCISEAQKYMGKLYQADSVKREGGKQDDWLTAVSAALGSYDGPLRSLVDKLALYDNIPRKPKAFENFVANSLNLKRDPVTVKKLWAIVESCGQRDTTLKRPNQLATPWTTYESEVASILTKSGGEMPWKLLQANLAKRRKATHPSEEYESIRLDVVANIPQRFLCTDTNLVKI